MYNVIYIYITTQWELTSGTCWTFEHGNISGALDSLTCNIVGSVFAECLPLFLLFRYFLLVKHCERTSGFWMVKISYKQQISIGRFSIARIDSQRIGLWHTNICIYIYMIIIAKIMTIILINDNNHNNNNHM